MAFNITLIPASSVAHFGGFFPWALIASFTSAESEEFAQTSESWPQDTLSLFETGCVMPNGTVWNCAEACQDPKELWDDDTNLAPYTVHNCMVYPIIAKLRHDGRLTRYADDLAEKFGIEPNASAVLTWPAITSCVADYCQTNAAMEGCKNPEYPTISLKSTGDEQFSNFTIGVPSNICYGVDATVNPHLGGPGVFLSYLMQTSWVVFTWIMWHWYDSWAQFVFWLNCVRSLGRHHAWRHAGRRQAKLRNSAGRETMVSAIKEFHKAQVFFMLTVQVAILVALTSQDFLESSSFQQYFNDFGIILDLILGGCLPVTIGYLMLRLAERPAKYVDSDINKQKDFRMEGPHFILFITAVCVMVAGSTWLYAWFGAKLKPDRAIDGIRQTLPGCGGRHTPVQYCLESNWWDKNVTNSYVGVAIVVICFFVVVMLALDHLKVFSISTENGRQRRVSCYGVFNAWTHSIQTKFYRRAIYHASRTIVFATELALIALNITLVVDYIRLLQPDEYSKAFDWSKWDLGQIIAVAIWVPVWLEYLWRTTSLAFASLRARSNGAARGPASVTDSPDHDEVRAKSRVEAATASARDSTATGEQV